MAKRHTIDLSRFVPAGGHIEAFIFIVNTVAGEEVLRVGLDRHAMVNGKGEILARMTPHEARQIARELYHTADLLETKEKIAKEKIYV
jgi:hypothetical protein